MIVTLTLNPSIDATLELSGVLRPGHVHRLQGVTRVAGGKGINVSHAIRAADRSTIAVFPSGARDLFATLVDDIGMPSAVVPISGAVRTNTTLTESDGTTSKFNGTGPLLSQTERDELLRTLLNACADARWLVMAGSLPPGYPENTYVELIRTVRAHYPELRIAVDTSDAAMLAMGRELDTAAPDLMKPNSFELGQLASLDGDALETAALRGEYETILCAAQTLRDQGVADVLVTLGAAGAVLVTNEGAWHAAPPRTTVVSTVGAGDCSLAGYVMAASDELSAPQRLAFAVAYGTAAASLPGTSIPTPSMVHVDDVVITPLVLPSLSPTLVP